MPKKRYALIPACISFGPLGISRMGGTIPDEPGYGLLATIVVVAGVILLTAGLSMMFQFLVEQQMAIESLRKERTDISNT
jgi:hypothetical protein